MYARVNARRASHFVLAAIPALPRDRLLTNPAKPATYVGNLNGRSCLNGTRTGFFAVRPSPRSMACLVSRPARVAPYGCTEAPTLMQLLAARLLHTHVAATSVRQPDAASPKFSASSNRPASSSEASTVIGPWMLVVSRSRAVRVSLRAKTKMLDEPCMAPSLSCNRSCRRTCRTSGRCRCAPG